jgi:hypothetical protein
MDYERLAQTMAENAERIHQLVDGISTGEARWRPDPDSWSILEVVNHLHDEEREDFRVRLDIMLHNPDRPWPPIDPQGWVKARKYNERELRGSLESFLAERRASLEWLEGLKSPDWEATVEAPWGSFRAGEMFAAWVAHDLLHMRQLVELHYAHVVRLADPYGTRYAGPWDPES